MAEYTPEEHNALRALIGDTEEPYTFSNSELDTMLTATDGDVRAAASAYWYTKAVSYSEMVDISEAGSSRKNSDLFKNAMALAQQYDDSTGGTDASATSTTRRIVRR